MAKIKQEDLEFLTNDEIREFYKRENFYDHGKISIIKEYVSEGKDTCTMGNRLVRVQNLLDRIIVKRFIKNEL